VAYYFLATLYKCSRKVARRRLQWQTPYEPSRNLSRPFCAH